MKSKWLLGMALAILPSAWAVGSALPDTVNYVEGQVTVNGQPVSGDGYLAQASEASARTVYVDGG